MLRQMWMWGVALAVGATSAGAAEPLTLENYTPPAANTPDEPVAQKFSLAKAVEFLDSASLDWTKSRQCFSCHTNYAYLMARPSLGFTDPACGTVRKAAEELVTKRWPDQGPRWDAEVVATAAALAFNDAATTQKLHPVTKEALDRIWKVQREDGGFSWLKCGWPPMESDDEYGAVLTLLAVGMAPDNYRSTPAAVEGLKKLRAYLDQTPLPTLHHRAMLLWASTTLEGWLTAEQQQAIVKDLLAKQLPDGGWSAASLGDWKRADDTPQQTDVSDGYGTGFVLYVLRRGGVDAADPRLQNAVVWLKTHQRASGRWYARSLKKDGKHFLTHAATAFAVMALAECGERSVAQAER